MTVFSVVVCCSAHDLCVVPYADIDSDKLWRFDTSTRGWEAVNNTAVNGAGPSGRLWHVMTAVGRNLWMHGGETDTTSEGDTCSSPPALLLLLYCGRD
jgi:hypothetical protein